MNDYIKYLKRNNYSKNTIMTYQNILKNYEKIINDIRNVKKKILSYSQNPNTAWTHYNILSAYFKFSKDKRLSVLQELKLPPIPIKYKDVFSKTYLMNRTDNLGDRKQLIVRFLFETGIRASELYHISEINKETLVLKGKGNKTREIFHNWDTTKHFSGFSFSTKTLRLWVKDVLGKQYTPHSIRRSHATHMLLKGANPKSVMLQLGHSKIETTYRYLHMSKKLNKKIYDKYF